MPVRRPESAFTLIEMLASIAIVVLLATFLLLASHRVQEGADRVACVNNLRQIHSMVVLYTGDHDGTFPGPIAARVPRGDVGQEFLPYYLRSYLPADSANAGTLAGLTGESAGTKVFTCPAHWRSAKFREIGNVWGRPAMGQASYGLSVVTSSPAERDAGMDRPVWGNVGVPLEPMKMAAIPDALRSKLWLMEDTDADWVLWGSGLRFHNEGRNILWLDGHVSWGKTDRVNPGQQTLTKPY